MVSSYDKKHAGFVIGAPDQVGAKREEEGRGGSPVRNEGLRVGSLVRNNLGTGAFSCYGTH